MKYKLLNIYKILLNYFGEQNWWPLRYGFEPKNFEVCIGAILTQNTGWQNVEKALQNLKKNGCTSVQDFINIKKSDLETIIKPSGFYKQKAERLKIFAEFINGFGSFENFLKSVSREQLLSIKGIGPETADSILLYACNRPEFVIDAYTKRFYARFFHQIRPYHSDYKTLKNLFEKNLPQDLKIYKEFHALIVKLAKDFCRKKPNCDGCPVGCENSGAA